MVALYLLLCCIIGALVLFPAASTRAGASGVEHARHGAKVGARVLSPAVLWWMAATAQVVLPIAAVVVMKEMHWGANSSAAIPFVAFVLGVAQVVFLLGVSGLLVGTRPDRRLARVVLAVLGALALLPLAGTLALFGADAAGAVFAAAAVALLPALSVLVERTSGRE